MPKSLSVKINAKNITQVFAGAAGLSFVAGAGLVFWLNQSLAAEQMSHAGLETQVGSSEKIAKQLQDTQAVYTQTSAKLAMLETSVTQKSYVPTLLQQIQTLAGSTHLTITNLHPGEMATPPPPAPAKSADNSGDAKKKATAPAPTYSTMNVDLNITGTYADTNRFVYGLTRFPKILSVVSIQMSPQQSGPTQTVPLVTTNLKLTAYIFPDDAASPAAGNAANTGTTGATQTAVLTTPPAAAPTVAGAAGRAALSAVRATRAVNSRASTAQAL
jgi:Tfp pilus assembly protein PilO